MNHNITGAVLAALSGVAIAFINYLFSKKVLIKSPEKFSLITVARQFLQVGFLVLVYFIGSKTQLADPMYLLVGAVIGMTLPMIYFTRKLLHVNESTAKKAEKIEDRGETDG